VRLTWAPAVAVASLAACSFDGDYAGTQYMCKGDERCPAGTTCQGGLCRAPGDVLDAAVATSEWASCAELRDAGEDDSAAYFIDPDGPAGEPAFEVYCDMVMDGGGWTLVARSVEGGEGAFGWFEEVGDVRELQEPYSLGVDRPGFTFSAMLVGSQSGGYGWGGRIYRVAGVPANFAVEYQDNATFTERTTVAGDCTPLAGPSMLQVIGYTDEIDHFFFRDQPIESAHGLGPGGWSLYYADCNNGGWLHEAQGMIFVR